MKWVVAKFGGSSMANPQAMSRCAEILKNSQANVVVVSATYGTTNQLVQLCELSHQGNWPKAKNVIEQIRIKHQNMIEEIGFDGESLEFFVKLLKQLRALVRGSCLLRECSNKARDGILSFGELCSSRIFYQILKEKFEQRKVQWFDSRKILATNDEFCQARPHTEAIGHNCGQSFTDPSALYIGQGFIGASPEGATTTLGRGGSDYSAALYAEGLGAEKLEIWTDVPGLASTDPRLVCEATPIATISFREAAEMATFGAKILHPATLSPAMRKNIPVFVGSTLNIEKAMTSGTLITKDVADGPLVRAVTKRSGQALISLSNPGMAHAFGFLKNVFDVFDRYQICVDAITTSEISVAMTVDKVVLQNKSFLNNLETLGKLTIEDDLSLVALIGNKIPMTPGLGQRIFKALESINVRMICQGASPHNFCIIVNENDADNAVKNLHKEFIK